MGYNFILLNNRGRCGLYPVLTFHPSSSSSDLPEVSDHFCNAFKTCWLSTLSSHDTVTILLSMLASTLFIPPYLRDKMQQTKMTKTKTMPQWWLWWWWWWRRRHRWVQCWIFYVGFVVDYVMIMVVVTSTIRFTLEQGYNKE